VSGLSSSVGRGLELGVGAFLGIGAFLGAFYPDLPDNGTVSSRSKPNIAAITTSVLPSVAFIITTAITFITAATVTASFILANPIH